MRRHRALRNRRRHPGAFHSPPWRCRAISPGRKRCWRRPMTTKIRKGSRNFTRGLLIIQTALISPRSNIRPFRDIAEAYQDYWRAVLLAPNRIEEEEIRLVLRVREIVKASDAPAAERILPSSRLGQMPPGGSGRDARAGAMARLSDWINENGYQSLTGRTAPHLELMLWRKSRLKVEQVALTDGVFDVDVNYLEGFIIRGWINFASLDEDMSAGWATGDALFCVSERWDLDAESYQVSFSRP